MDELQGGQSWRRISMPLLVTAVLTRIMLYVGLHRRDVANTMIECRRAVHLTITAHG